MPFEQANQALQHDWLRALGEAPFAVELAVLTIGFEELTLSPFPSAPDNLSGQEAALSDKPKPKNRFVRVIVGVVVVAISRATESYNAWLPCPDKINLRTGVLVVWIYLGYASERAPERGGARLHA